MGIGLPNRLGGIAQIGCCEDARRGGAKVHPVGHPVHDPRQATKGELRSARSSRTASSAAIRIRTLRIESAKRAISRFRSNPSENRLGRVPRDEQRGILPIKRGELGVRPGCFCASWVGFSKNISVTTAKNSAGLVAP